jgi:hypothetical protein
LLRAGNLATKSGDDHHALKTSRYDNYYVNIRKFRLLLENIFDQLRMMFV